MLEEKVSYYEDINEIEKKIWTLLTGAVKERISEFRTPVFICGNEKDLDGRVVVLRRADQKNNFVQFHSDIRSSKIEKIKKNPNCSVLFYGKKEKIQLRIKTECEINYNNEITKDSWNKTGHISRKCYLVTNGPGTQSNEPTSGLDPKQLIEIRDIITKIGKEKTILLSTHIIQEVEAMCNRIIIINNGEIIANKKIEEFENKIEEVFLELIK